MNAAGARQSLPRDVAGLRGWPSPPSGCTWPTSWCCPESPFWSCSICAPCRPGHPHWPPRTWARRSPAASGPAACWWSSTCPIMLLGGYSGAHTWVLVILYFTVCHSTLVLLGVVGLAKAMAGQCWRYPLIGRPLPAGCPKATSAMTRTRTPTRAGLVPGRLLHPVPAGTAAGYPAHRSDPGPRDPPGPCLDPGDRRLPRRAQWGRRCGAEPRCCAASCRSLGAGPCSSGSPGATDASTAAGSVRTSPPSR